MNSHTSFVIVSSLCIAVLLTIMPLPHGLIGCRPQWVFATLCFWVLRFPEMIGVGVSFWIGILMDCVTGAPLGYHALIYTALAYVLLKWHTQLARLPLWQQTGMIFFLSCAALLTQRLLLHWMGYGVYTVAYWLPMLTTSLIWPFLSALLYRLSPTVIIR